MSDSSKRLRRFGPWSALAAEGGEPAASGMPLPLLPWTKEAVESRLANCTALANTESKRAGRSHANKGSRLLIVVDSQISIAREAKQNPMPRSLIS